MEKQQILSELFIIAKELNRLSRKCANYQTNSLNDVQQLNELTMRHLYLTDMAKKLLKAYCADSPTLESQIGLKITEYNLNQILKECKISWSGD
ncbi:hypothetical protein [Mucilaginibacter agri]|uniref:Uncharacterized protein n=1 Tax=Mucilaginibacter agri TaxID=2695265 RepID=A0A965ZDH5_9SPHI|nr:hypothetical protein [Mucilaginibacter agri]NCD67757.1 hypothetical protein [Mucilaginibacter agri]